MYAVQCIFAKQAWNIPEELKVRVGNDSVFDDLPLECQFRLFLSIAPIIRSASQL